jgi:hypothetical protein
MRKEKLKRGGLKGRNEDSVEKSQMKRSDFRGAKGWGAAESSAKISFCAAGEKGGLEGSSYGYGVSAAAFAGLKGLN